MGKVVQYVRKHGGLPLWRLKNILRVDREEPSKLRGIYRNLRATARWWYDNTRRDYLYWKYEKENPPVDFPMPGEPHACASREPACDGDACAALLAGEDHVLPREASAGGVDLQSDEWVGRVV